MNAVRALHRPLFTPRRLRLYPTAGLLGAIAGFGVFLATSNGLTSADGGRVGGDFPAFYGAGRLARTGAADKLYEPATQRAAQADLLPSDTTGYIHFPYPPFVAIAYAPFTYLGFKAAYVLHTLLMAICCAIALRLLWPIVPRAHGYFVPCLAAILTFYPMYRAVVGGQNTAISLLCASGAALALARGRDLTAGIWLGVWLFKPQLALFVAAVLVLSGHPLILAGMAIVSSAYYAIGAVAAGPGWPLWWLREGVLDFAARSAIAERGNGVSLPEVAADFGVPIAGWIAAAIAAAAVAWLLARRRTDPAVLVGAAATAAVLISPHAIFYDAGVAAIGLAAIAHAAAPALLAILPAAWLLAATHAARGALPFPPLTILLIGTVVLALYVARQPQSDRDANPHLDD